MISPCKKICIYDAQKGLCEGCGRTKNEIANWLNYTDAQRKAAMEKAAERLKN